MGQKKRSTTAENNAKVYKSSNRELTNRKKKLEKQAKLQPNNTKVTEALKDIHRRRHTPKNPFWSASKRRTARLFKEFAGRFDVDILSANPKVSLVALQMQSPVAARGYPDFITKMKKSDWNFFSIETRLGR